MHQSPSPSFDTLVFVLADIKLVKRSVTAGPMNPNRNPFLIFNSIFGCDIKLIIIFLVISFSTTNAATFFQIFNMQSGIHGQKIRSMDPCPLFQNSYHNGDPWIPVVKFCGIQARFQGTKITLSLGSTWLSW